MARIHPLFSLGFKIVTICLATIPTFLIVVYLAHRFFPFSLAKIFCKAAFALNDLHTPVYTTTALAICQGFISTGMWSTVPSTGTRCWWFSRIQRFSRSVRKLMLLCYRILTLGYLRCDLVPCADLHEEDKQIVSPHLPNNGDGSLNHGHGHHFRVQKQDPPSRPLRHPSLLAWSGHLEHLHPSGRLNPP